MARLEYWGARQMTLRKLIAGNWKMNGNLASLAELDAVAAVAKNYPDIDVAMFPPITLIAPAVSRQPKLAIGAQDCHWRDAGPHTGCSSGAMLREAGATMVIVGHSERRTDQSETNNDVRLKAQAAVAEGLIAIICVGETEAERDCGDAVACVVAQVRASVPLDSRASSVVIAYEPVWAIGTGRTPSAADIAEIHRAIRQTLEALLGNEGEGVRILYGGSVKPNNAGELLHIANVDGALVGGASLKAADFIPILAAASASR
jgi:triosephosphate isomerase (TIM)